MKFDETEFDFGNTSLSSLYELPLSSTEPPDCDPFENADELIEKLQCCLPNYKPLPEPEDCGTSPFNSPWPTEYGYRQYRSIAPKSSAALPSPVGKEVEIQRRHSMEIPQEDHWGGQVRRRQSEGSDVSSFAHFEFLFRDPRPASIEVTHKAGDGIHYSLFSFNPFESVDQKA